MGMEETTTTGDKASESTDAYRTRRAAYSPDDFYDLPAQDLRRVERFLESCYLTQRSGDLGLERSVLTEAILRRLRPVVAGILHEYERLLWRVDQAETEDA